MVPMPSNTSVNGDEDFNKPQTNTELLASINDQLVVIADHIRKAERRERWQFWGNVIKTIIHFLPSVLFLVLAVYLYYHTDDLLKALASYIGQTMSQAGQQGAENFWQSGSEAWQQIQEYFSSRS